MRYEMNIKKIESYSKTGTAAGSLFLIITLCLCFANVFYDNLISWIVLSSTITICFVMKMIYWDIVYRINNKTSQNQRDDE